MEQKLNNSTIIEASKKLGPVHEYDIIGSFSSSSSSILSDSSLEFDSFEEVTSPPSSSSSLDDMSSLFQQLPIKRGLSKHYEGKSQSFTSLSNVRSLEDLAKPENPYNKKLKSSRSYGGGLAESHKVKGTTTPSAMSKHVSKKGMNSTGLRGSCSSLSARKGSGAPIPPHRSTSTTTIPNQTALFA